MRNASSFDSDQFTESLSVISAMNSPLAGYSSFGIGSPTLYSGNLPGPQLSSAGNTGKISLSRHYAWKRVKPSGPFCAPADTAARRTPGSLPTTGEAQNYRRFQEAARTAGR